MQIALLEHFIDGSTVSPSSGRYLDAFDPTTGSVVSHVARGDGTDVGRAVAAAKAALPAWRGLRPIVRGRILTEIARAVRNRSDELAALERRETGKANAVAKAEMEVVAQYFEFYGGLATAVHGERIDIGEGYHSYTRREPYGVIGAILPWNAPLNQAARACSPALTTGNTVVAKPSESTSGTTLALARMAVEECGLPKGVFNVVTGLGKEAGEPLVTHPDVRKVCFTGSLRGGREVGRVAAERILPLTLELGGKSPNIVFADADLALAVPGVLRGFLSNSGQVCLAGTRILVERSVCEAFTKMLVDAMSELRAGSADNEIAPITTYAQYEKVQHYYSLAKAEGAVAAVGGALPRDGTPGDGWFVAPTLYVGVSRDMRIAREEIFGPIACVIVFDDEAHAIELANDTEYGLAAGLWTRDLARAHRVAALLEAGQIYVNEYFAGGVETPLGGYKSSGYGREKGVEALRHYTHVKCVTIKL